jgi:hypothetical protein
MQAKDTFATAINCMDGRTQDPATAFMREKTNVAFVDTITGPGMVKKVVDASRGDTQELDRVRTALYVSLQKHASQGVGVFAHQECAGNPVADEQQIEELHVAGTFIRSLAEEVHITVPVWGVFVYKNDSGVWVAEQKVVLA